MPTGIDSRTFINKVKDREKYLDQLPSVIVVELIPEYTPTQQILVGLIRADIRSIPLMQDILISRKRNTIFQALDDLKRQEKVVVYKNLWWETTTPMKKVREETKKYWRSKRNPKGRIHRGRYNAHDWETINDQFLEKVNANKKWKRKLPSLVR